MTRKLRIAWVSDFDCDGGEGETLSSYCSRLLLPLLRERFDIEVFTELPTLQVDPTVARHYLTAIRRHREQPFDIFFYQLEDHRKARFVRSHIGVMPGVLWAHDLYLSDLGAEALHTSPWERTIRQFHGVELPFADRRTPPHQLAPLAHREVSMSPVVLCSSQRGLGAVKRIAGPRITTGASGDFLLGYVPVPVQRTGRGIGASEVLRFASSSSVGLEGRGHKFLPALRDLSCEWRLTWLIDPHERARAESLVAEFGVSERVAIVCGRTPARWSEIVHGAEIALHLHNGFFGHTGPYLHISLEAGVPCITSRAIGGVDYPEDVVWTVVPGQTEAAQIRYTALQILQRGVSESGLCGQSLVHSESEVSSVADVLAVTFERSAPPLADIMRRWDALYRTATETLCSEVGVLMDGASVAGPIPSLEILPQARQDLGW